MLPVGRPPQWAGREQELAKLRAGVEALGRGEGAVVWVEGEAGIGKSSLVAEALAEASQPGWDVGWGVADQLTERLPLRVMQDCLQVRPGSPDPRRARAAALLRSRRLGLFADGDSSVIGVEVLAALADELCAAAPTVIVLDDLQWADDASLIVWHHLAASIDQLRLLLIATCRPTPRLQEAVTAGILAGSGAELAFRHLLIQQALYESMPAALRTALHAEAARELAAAGGDALSVAQQLLAADRPDEDWARAWLIESAPALIIRAPQLAVDPLRRELDETPAAGQAPDGLRDIARGMFLSRRTVQTYISRILTKLGAKGRVEIVREALRQGVSP